MENFIRVIRVLISFIFPCSFSTAQDTSMAPTWPTSSAAAGLSGWPVAAWQPEVTVFTGCFFKVCFFLWYGFYWVFYTDFYNMCFTFSVCLFVFLGMCSFLASLKGMIFDFLGFMFYFLGLLKQIQVKQINNFGLAEHLTSFSETRFPSWEAGTKGSAAWELRMRRVSQWSRKGDLRTVRLGSRRGFQKNPLSFCSKYPAVSIHIFFCMEKIGGNDRHVDRLENMFLWALKIKKMYYSSNIWPVGDNRNCSVVCY